MNNRPILVEIPISPLRFLLLVLGCFAVAGAFCTVANGEWYDYNPPGAKNGCTIHEEMMSRCPQYGVRQILQADKATQAHEATHFVNHEISQTRRQMYGAFYVGGGKCLILPEPKTTIGQVAECVPAEQRLKVFKQYLTGDRVTRNAMSAIDEFVCYTNDAQCTQELGLQDDGGLRFATEFCAYADAVVAAIQKHDPNYSGMKELTGFVRWQKQRVAKLIAGAQTKRTDVYALPTQWGPQYQREQIADLAMPFRQRNRGGSCVHASCVMDLRWLGLYAKADAYWAKYHGGEYASRHRKKLLAEGLKFLMTDDGDERVLEYAVASRRGAGVTWGGAHCVFFAGRVNGEAVLIDNNAINRFKTQPWDRFIREWNNCGGWAFVILDGEVPPPTPTS